MCMQASMLNVGAVSLTYRLTVLHITINAILDLSSTHLEHVQPAENVCLPAFAHMPACQPASLPACLPALLGASRAVLLLPSVSCAELLAASTGQQQTQGLSIIDVDHAQKAFSLIIDHQYRIYYSFQSFKLSL